MTCRRGAWWRLGVLLPLCLLVLACGAARPDRQQLLIDLGDSRWQVRASAAEALGRRGVQEAVPGLVEALQDPSGPVRAAAVMSLGRLQATSALDEIVTVIEKDGNAQVRVQAIFALASLGDESHADLMVRTTRDKHRRVERAAKRVLWTLVDRDAFVTEVKEGLHSGSFARRRKAVAGAALLRPGELDEAARQVVEEERRSERPAERKAVWEIDRIEDRLELSRAGECTLRRTVTVRVDRIGGKLAPLRILMPASFPQVEGVVRDDGTDLEFELRWEDGFREIEVDLPRPRREKIATLTLAARSRRPLFSGGKQDARLVYSPAPFRTDVGELLVEVVVPGGDPRVIAPAEARVLTPEGGAKLVTWTRWELPAGEARDLNLQVALPRSSLDLSRPLPAYHSLRSDLGIAGAVAAVVLASLVAVIIRLRRRRNEQAHRPILVAVLTAGAFLFLTPILLEDNLAYYASARSAIVDGDLDRGNELTEFNRTQMFTPDNRGPQDPALAWISRIPSVALAHVVTLGLNLFSSHHAANGFSFPYLFITALGDFLAVLAGCLACFSLIERRVGRRYALFGVLSVVFGTNLMLFAYAWTGSSFQPSFLLFAVFLDFWDRTRDRRGLPGWLGAGVLFGLLAMTRTLNLGYGVLPLLDWLFVALPLVAAFDRRSLARHVGRGALFAAGVLAGYAPQLVLQRLLDHTWMVDAYGVGSGRFQGLRDNLWGLFVERKAGALDGLLPAMPLLLLVPLGLLLLIRLDRRLGVLVVATLGVQLLAIASYEVYWGYFEYGTPYLAPSAPIFCLAMAALLRGAHELWRRQGQALLVSLVALLSLRSAWCVMRQLADDVVGDHQEDMNVLQVLHSMLLPERKLNVDVIGVTSEFGVLLRESTGALAAGAPAQLLVALLWASLLLVPLLLAGPVRHRAAAWLSTASPLVRERLAPAVLALAALAAVGSLAGLALATDLDYDYDEFGLEERNREFKVQRLAAGESYSWEYDFDNPCARVSVVTFLDDAVSVPQGAQVGTVRVESGGESTEFALLAGVDTADFFIARPELRAEARHLIPGDRVNFSWRIRDDSSRLYTARTYLSTFQVPSALNLGEVTVTSNIDRGALAVVIMTAQERKLARDPTRRRWLADRW